MYGILKAFSKIENYVKISQIFMKKIFIYGIYFLFRYKSNLKLLRNPPLIILYYVIK